MKTAKSFTTILVGLALMFTLAGAWRADAFLSGFGNQGKHGKAGVSGGPGNANMGITGDLGTGMESAIIKALIQLNLTEAQKQAIAAILKEYQQAVKESAIQVLDAKKDLFETIHSNVFDEEAVRTASKAVASAEEELAVLRATIVSEVRAVLTPEQIATLDQIKTDISARIKSRVEHIQYLINLWIQQHS